MKTPGSPLSWVLRFALLYILFTVLFVIGTLPLAGVMPSEDTTEPGLVSPMSGLLIVAAVHVAVVAALILTTRWRGWKLAVGYALVYYVAVTVLPQTETWYFLSSITVGPRLLPLLFLMGIPPAFVFVPLAVWILGRGSGAPDASTRPKWAMPMAEWIWRLAIVVTAYIVLYWGAGYFIAWQNPELRAFYGQPGEAAPFVAHTLDALRDEPQLFAFQAFRALLWVLCALPVILGSGVNRWWTALVVGLLFSAPQNAGMILANPLMPVASVRLSHMIETASSTFIFGVIVVWVFYRGRHRPGDLGRP